MSSKQRDLTNQVKQVCLTLVQDHLGHEKRLFSYVWTAFWHALDCHDIYELAAFRGEVQIVKGASILDLGAVGKQSGQEIDSLHVVSVISSASAKLLSQSVNTELTISHVAGALRLEAGRPDIPLHICHLLERHAVRLLAELFSAEVNTDAREVSPFSLDLWVEWCRTNCEPHEEPPISKQMVPETEFQDKCGTRMEYILWVDERSLLIWVCGRNLWHELKPRHRRLLYLVLYAFGHTRCIHYEDILRKALQNEWKDVSDSGTEIRKIKSELNGLLDNILDQHIEASRGEYRYDIRGQLPYCWIRKNRSHSVLLRTP